MSQATTRIEKQAGSSAIIRLWEALIPLKSVVSFMSTGAHPDDETSALLARLSKADGVRIAYCCATRGQGGQNALGTEKSEHLGLLRTREMEEAARVLDMELYWLGLQRGHSILDFGFSKSGEETFEQWGKEHTLELLVRAIRSFRPDIICPTFLNVPGQHGHHRAMTIATEEAFSLAAKAEAFPEHASLGLKPWQVKKMYLPAFSGAGSSYDDSEPPPPATVEVSTGDFDPVFGATYEQMAQWSRTMHKTQGMGTWRIEENQSMPLHLLDSVLNLPKKENSLFAGLPVTFVDLAESIGFPDLKQLLLDLQAKIDHALAAFPNYPEVAKQIHAALKDARSARNWIAQGNLEEGLAEDLDHRLWVKDRQLSHASYCALLLVSRLESSPSDLVEGSHAVFKLSVYRGGGFFEIESLDLVLPENWEIEEASSFQKDKRVLNPGQNLTTEFRVKIPENGAFPDPYQFHSDPKTAHSLVSGVLRYQVDGVSVEKMIEPEENISLLPRFSMTLFPDKIVYNLNQTGKIISLRVNMTLHGSAPAEETLQPEMPAGWICEPRNRKLSFLEKGESQTVKFQIVPPDLLQAGKYEIRMNMESQASLAYHLQKVDYPHIRSISMPVPISFLVQAISVEISDQLVIGYVEGGADRMGDWLEQLGLRVERLTAETLTTGDLSQYDTIVVGVFAFRTRPDLQAANRRMKEYVHQGGNLVTFYHRPQDHWDPETTVPYFLKIGLPSLRWRITNQNAEVTYLSPDHVLLNYPNRTTAEDWQGWVKERGLYFASEWADEYEALLSMSDPGESPLKGSLLTAKYGQGRHTHTALSLHYQVDFLVPGAFRLLVNLITPALET